LPEKEWRPVDASPLASSPDALGHLLESWSQVQVSYREKAAAAMNANSNRNCQAAEPIPANKKLRWDAVRNALVEIEKDAESVRLHRFDPSGNEIAAHPHVLRELRDVCQRHLQIENETHSRLVDDEEWPPLSVRFPDYSADIWRDRASFTFYELTPSVARLMLELARTGDMSVIAMGSVILTDPGQADRLPQSWKRMKQITSCQSTEELSELLMNLQVGVPAADRDYGFNNQHSPLAGTYPARPRIMYVETNLKETPGEHQTKVFNHAFLSPEVERSGTLKCEFWRLETPTGQQFLSYGFTSEYRKAQLHDFARSQKRSLGSIINFETFVRDDGGRFRIDQCKMKNVTDEL